MTGRRTMMVLATDLLAGPLLETGAAGPGGGGGFSAGSMGGFGGGHVGGFGGGHVGGFSGSHVAGFGGARMAGMGRDHHGYGRRGFGGYYYGSCPYYTSYDWPYTCTY